MKLARRGLTNAEIERALQELTPRVGKAAPSYSAVRRIANVAREPSVTDAYLEEIIPFLLLGRVPNMYEVEARVKRRLAGA